MRHMPTADAGGVSMIAAAGDQHTKHHVVPWVLISLGALAICAGGAWQLRATLWMSHYHRVGISLIHQEEASIAAARKRATVAGTAGTAGASGKSGALEASTASASTTNPAGTASCAATSASGPQGLLQFPELGVVAPVEEGASDAVLAVAVGHDPSSVWPGTKGTSVLLSHDVTYFVNIGNLKTNDVVTYVTPCANLTYAVTGHKIVLAGTTIYNSSSPTMDLVTCYPSNALFYTDQRLVVTLRMIKSTPSDTTHAVASPASQVPTIDAREPLVPAPRPLAAQGLTLATNYAPMGTLSIVGTPNSRYVQSPAALLAQDAALSAYFGGLKALASDHLDWWRDLAPHVAVPSVFVGHTIASYAAAMNVSIEASNFSIRGVTLRDSVRINGSTYAMRIDMAVSARNVLTITSWKV